MSIALSVVALSLIGADLPPMSEVTKTTTVREAPKEVWSLTLDDAIRIALDNSETVRVISLGVSGLGVVPFPSDDLPKVFPDPAPLLIGPVNSSCSRAQFQTEVMAAVRSIEQRYWTLHQQHSELQANEKAVELAREVFKREQAKLQGHGGAAEVAEAEQRLTKFMLESVMQATSLNEAELRLRKVLGLPPSDNRRIVPATSPTKALVKRDWDECLAAMLRHQPEIVQLREPIEQHDQRIDIVCQEIIASLPTPLTEIGSAIARELRVLDMSQTQPQRDLLQQAIHKRTHSLAQIFLEIDSNYKLMQISSRSRARMMQRFSPEQMFYEEGRTPIDRYFDALEQSVNAVASEANWKTAYNVSIACLEENKGTLLEARGIVLADPLHPRTVTLVEADPAPLDAAVKHAAHEEALAPQAASSPAAAAGAKTVKFQFTINGGPQPIRIEGTLKFGDDAKMSVVVPDSCQFVGPGTLKLGDDAKTAPGAR